MVALLAWLKVHQLDRMTNEKTRKHGIAFKFEFNNRETVDISLQLDLTERIAVNRRGRSPGHPASGRDKAHAALPGQVLKAVRGSPLLKWAARHTDSTST
ncbi:phage tail protein [Janthinobacterium sp. GW460P]|uniref:phage tail protein n=1 Tax=unclassified Janthinobacterium TaxID=2610881 RepID=UPI000A31F072|nr:MULTISPECIES: phage tail protein [unclassified Janthinobacterium]MCC7703975.1 phage tail protein [Janthinobacterium sp. GW460P]MCC7709482.1 phage tail protein [Janthinobacterium sp. GW460W]